MALHLLECPLSRCKLELLHLNQNETVTQPSYLEPATRLLPVLFAATGDLRRPAVGTSTSGQQQILPLHSFVYASSDMGSTDLTEYVAFEEKVRRTVYLDNISPLVTESVLRNGLNQFGTVKSSQFIQNYTESKNIPLCALVEMGNVKQAKAVVAALGEFPFMMSGMPRPVRARLAEVEMFDDRPKKPGRKRHCCWLNPNGPDFEVAQKLKRLVQKHAAEASFLLKKQLQEEEKLEKHQEDSLKANYKKYELIEGIMGDGTAKRLAQQYGYPHHECPIISPNSEIPHHLKYGASIKVAPIDRPRRRQKGDDRVEKFYCAVSDDVVGDASRSTKKSQEIMVEDFGFQNLNCPSDMCPSSTKRDLGDFVDRVDLLTNNDSFVPKGKETFLTFSDSIKFGAHHSQGQYGRGTSRMGVGLSSKSQMSHSKSMHVNLGVRAKCKDLESSSSFTTKKKLKPAVVHAFNSSVSDDDISTQQTVKPAKQARYDR
ncbi:hypothetical protein QYF36_022881 [Acer negundo]|nr:hypothetical protein QYF36_022881 [Acer negundo]